MKNLEPHHLTDLRKSGLSDEVIEKSNIYSASAKEVKDIVGWNPKTPGLAIPFPGTENDDGKPFTRVKLDNPPTIKDKVARYLTPKGSKNRVYIPVGIEPILSDPEQAILVTEGEKKAMKATQEGLSCISSAGIWGWRCKGDDGKGRPSPDLDKINWSGRVTYIVFDSDAPLNPEVLRAERALAQELASRGAKVSVIRLPGDPGRKVGLDDYLLAHTTEDFWQLPRVDPLESPPKVGNKTPEKLVALTSSIPIFCDQTDTCCAFIAGEVIPLESKRFKAWISYQLYLAEGKAPSEEALKGAINVMKAQTYIKDKIELFNRVAKKDGAFWFDLGNGKAVRTTACGWDVVPAPILFRRYGHQLPQVEPRKNGDPDRVFEFLNIREDHRLLFIVYLISIFVLDMNHPILSVFGTQGAGKTFMLKIMKALCDPSYISVLIGTTDRRELVQMAVHNYVVPFDNMGSLPGWLSDLLSQAITGTGHMKRALFTDDDDVNYQVKGVFMVNGITQLISKPDLMDRALVIELERITSTKCRGETELWEAFQKAKPEILGGIFDILSKAMALYPTIKLQQHPRMADFTAWGNVIAEAYRGAGEDFLRDYAINRGVQNEEILQNNTLAQAVIRKMNQSPIWETTIGEAFLEMKNLFYPDEGSRRTPIPRDDTTFPKTSKSLRRFLARIRTTLQDNGIEYKIGPRGENGYPITFKNEKYHPEGDDPLSPEERAWQHGPEDLGSGDASGGKPMSDAPDRPAEANEAKQEDFSNLMDGYL